MSIITYNCTALVGINKVGELQRDANGYYEVVLGALQAWNSAGQFYPLEEAKQLFESSSSLQRRVRSGNLRGECGHPRYQPGMSEQQWFSRVEDLYEPNLCVHIAEVSLSYDTLKDPQGRNLVAIMGRVRPSGAGERYLERQLSNPKENVCFSIRSFTLDRQEGGVIKKYLKRIVTWDNVNEPGIAVANKYSVPSLESQHLALDSYQFQCETLVQYATQTQCGSAGVSMESQAAAGEILQLVGELSNKPRIVVPRSFNW